MFIESKRKTTFLFFVTDNSGSTMPPDRAGSAQEHLSAHPHLPAIRLRRPERSLKFSFDTVRDAQALSRAAVMAEYRLFHQSGTYGYSI